MKSKNINNYNLHITILVGALIIGVMIVLSQFMKQSSIEKQLEIKLRQERLKNVKYENSMELLDQCLKKAEREYFEYAEINGEIQQNGIIRAPQFVWDIAEKNKQQKIENCRARYQ